MTRVSIFGPLFSAAALAAGMARPRAGDQEDEREAKRAGLDDARRRQQRELVDATQRPIIRMAIGGNVTELIIPVTAPPVPHTREQHRNRLQQLAGDAKREALQHGASPRQARRAARRARRLGQVEALAPEC